MPERRAERLEHPIPSRRSKQTTSAHPPAARVIGTISGALGQLTKHNSQFTALRPDPRRSPIIPRTHCARHPCQYHPSVEVSLCCVEVERQSLRQPNPSTANPVATLSNTSRRSPLETSQDRRTGTSSNRLRPAFWCQYALQSATPNRLCFFRLRGINNKQLAKPLSLIYLDRPTATSRDNQPESQHNVVLLQPQPRPGKHTRPIQASQGTCS